MHFWKLCRLDVLLTMGRELVKGKQRSVPLSQPTRPTGVPVKVVTGRY